jgi:hypothetical protein
MILFAILIGYCMPRHTDFIEPQIADVCKQKVYFDECLSKIPEISKSLQYNNWAEIVDACEQSSYKLSIKMSKYVENNCKVIHNRNR